jgi:hypothetical protein
MLQYPYLKHTQEVEMWHFGQEDGRPTRYIIPNYAEGVYFN